MHINSIMQLARLLPQLTLGELNRSARFSDSYIILDPKGLPYEFKDWTKWQGALRIACVVNQRGKCPACGNDLTTIAELHHALISKAKAASVKDAARIIHDSRNVLLMCHQCHYHTNRKENVTQLEKIFGKWELSYWWEGLRFKPYKHYEGA